MEKKYGMKYEFLMSDKEKDRYSDLKGHLQKKKAFEN